VDLRGSWGERDWRGEREGEGGNNVNIFKTDFRLSEKLLNCTEV